MQENVLIIGASPRKNGNSDKIITHFSNGVKSAGCSFEIIQLRDLTMSPCVGCERCRKDKICTRFDDDMSPIYKKIVKSKGIFMVSPVHHYNVTAWMKAFIDRLYCFYNFEDVRPSPWSSRLENMGKKAVVAAISEQKTIEDMGFTINAMQKPLKDLGFEVIHTLPFLGVFSKGKISENQSYLEETEKYGKYLAEQIS